MPFLARRRRWAVAAVAVALVTLVAVAVPQVRSYISHIGRSPIRTWALEPFPPGDEPVVRIAAAGDVGHPGGREQATADAIAAAGRDRPYDALVLLGDQVYPTGDPDELGATVFTPFAKTLQAGATLLPILGNHDVMDGNADRNVELLGMPGRWYARDVGNVLFVGLDSNDLSPTQLAWLDDVLAQSDATWKVVAVHHPPYSAGYQGSSVDVRLALAPIVERRGVQLVLSGHEHDYQRSVAMNGVTYIVSGAGSETRRTGDEEFTAASWSWHHFLDIAFYADRAVVRAVNQDLRVFDEVEIPAVG